MASNPSSNGNNGQKRFNRQTVSATTASAEEYKVGPGRPPREYQFKPGKSGNPKGAKPKPPSIAPDLKLALEQDHRMVIQLTITPRRSTPGLFDAHVCDRLICSSRQPLLDAARVLLAEGIAADTLIEMRHAGADHVALRAKVMAAAKLRVLEGQRDTIRFARWSDFEGFNLPTRAGKDFVNGAGPGNPYRGGHFCQCGMTRVGGTLYEMRQSSAPRAHSLLISLMSATIVGVWRHLTRPVPRTSLRNEMSARCLGGAKSAAARFNPQVLFFMDGKFTASRLLAGAAVSHSGSIASCGSDASSSKSTVSWSISTGEKPVIEMSSPSTTRISASSGSSAARISRSQPAPSAIRLSARASVRLGGLLRYYHREAA
jgi:hypothetical protein